MPHGFGPLSDLRHAPRVWLLMGNKAGDNTQVLALAEGLGWPYEVKRFVYGKYEFVPNLLLGRTLKGIVREQSSPIEAPWPDLVISAGRRNEPIARWIKQQAPDRVRIVHVGRPWGRLDEFDLIVTTPQYRLPVRPNVLHNKTPLHRVTSDRLALDAARWQDRLAHLPRPFIAVIVGGSSNPYTYDDAAALRLARAASELAKQRGGSLLITTSARTLPSSIDVLEQNVDAPAYLYRWAKDAPDNPYFAFLGLASEIIVTGDSMSMLAEACSTRKPVYIFDLGEGEKAMRPETAAAMRAAASAAAHDKAPNRRFSWSKLGAFLYSQFMKVGPERFSRDIRIIHSYLVDSGRAVWLGDQFPLDRPRPPLDCLARAVARVRALVPAQAETVSFTERRFVGSAAE